MAVAASWLGLARNRTNKSLEVGDSTAALLDVCKAVSNNHVTGYEPFVGQRRLESTNQ